MLRRALPPLCWSPGLGQLHRNSSQSSQENATTTSPMAQVTPMDKEKVAFPLAQGLFAKVSLLPLQPTKGATPAPTLPYKQGH